MKPDISMKVGRALSRDLWLQESAGVGLQLANGAVSGGFCFSLSRGAQRATQDVHDVMNRCPSEVS